MAIDLNRADNSPKNINSDLLKFVNELIREAGERGTTLRIFEGYRSNDRQNYLFSVKKTTSLKGGQSKHNILPSQAVTILEYKNNQPSFDPKSFPYTDNFKKIVNNLLLKYPSIQWGGNWTRPLPIQFEITVTTPKTIDPPQVFKPVSTATTTIITDDFIIPKKMPESVKLTPAAIDVKIDNSTLIIGALALGLFLYIRK
jgi:hypothetical protein